MRLVEFAPSGGNGDDGFSEETLKRLAAQWYNGDEDPQVEATLMAAGWEIGQDEGYDDEPGVFVVQSGDINGNSYISWPAHELEQGVAEGLEQQLLECNRSGWTLVEDATNLQILKSNLFDQTLADKLKQYQGLQDKISEFLSFKKANPGQPWGSNDTPFVGAGPIGRALPKLKHAHLTRDLSLYYTIEGRNPTVIKLYGVFNHKESGTGTPGNIQKQKSLAKRLVNS